MSTIISAFFIALAFIGVIGAQNAFMLKQGLKNQHVTLVVLLYFGSDLLLMTAGIFGMGALLSQNEAALFWIKWAGILFLFLYGAKCFYTAYSLKEAIDLDNNEKKPLLPTVLTFIAVTWLNPHVYLDTIVLIGSISTQYESKFLFWLGCMLASLLLALSLGYGARKAAPFFVSVKSWKILESAMGSVLWIIAITLI